MPVTRKAKRPRPSDSALPEASAVSTRAIIPSGHLDGGHQSLRISPSLSQALPNPPVALPYPTIPLSSLLNDGQHLELVSAVIMADKETREAPWYAAWALVLSRFFSFVEHTDQATAIHTITSPQFPLVSEIDTYEHDLEVNELPLTLAARPTRSQRIQKLVVASSDSLGISLPLSDVNVTPPRNRDLLGSGTAASPYLLDVTSPSVHPSSSDANFTTTPRTIATATAIHSSNHSDNVVSDQDLHPSEPVVFTLDKESPAVEDTGDATEDHVTYSSLRVPDFVLMFCELMNGTNGELEIFQKRCVLIVEIKSTERVFNGRSAKVRLWDVHRRQMAEQALHAFENDKTLRTIGCIAAAGPYWCYEEKTRKSSHPRDLRDPTYSPTPGVDYDSDHSIGRKGKGREDRMSGGNDAGENDVILTELQQQLKGAFPDRALHILEDESRRVFNLVLKRLIEINDDIWINSKNRPRAQV